MKKEYVMDPVNQRVRDLRKALKLTQLEFSKSISLSSGQVACIETGRRVVNDRIIKLICVAFNVNDKWLKHGEGEIFLPQEDLKFTRFADLFADLKPEHQDFILTAMNWFLKMQEEENRRDS